VNAMNKRYNALIQKIKKMPKAEQIEYKKKKIQQQQANSNMNTPHQSFQEVSWKTYGFVSIVFVGWLISLGFQLM
ncbi:teichoic acid ABC transporter ATP-binding protein, partial [Staphylococcus chromogenes]